MSFKTKHNHSTLKTKSTKDSYLLNSSKNRSLLNLAIILLSLILLISSFSFINWLINFDKTATLDFYLAPSTATLTIDQQTFKSDGKIKLKPGNYTIKISHPDFTEMSKELKLNSSQTTFLYEYLEPETQTDYYQSHPEEQSRVQHISDFKADLERKKYTDSDPIFNITPYSSYKDGFSISAEKQENTSKILLKINLFTCSNQQIESLKHAALQYLSSYHLNPHNYDIKYTDC